MFISLWLAKFLFLPFYLTNRELDHFMAVHARANDDVFRAHGR